MQPGPSPHVAQYPQAERPYSPLRKPTPTAQNRPFCAVIPQIAIQHKRTGMQPVAAILSYVPIRLVPP